MRKNAHYRIVIRREAALFRRLRNFTNYMEALQRTPQNKILQGRMEIAKKEIAILRTRNNGNA